MWSRHIMGLPRDLKYTLPQSDTSLVITIAIIAQHVLWSTMRALWLFLADGSQAPQIITDISVNDARSYNIDRAAPTQ